MLLSISKWRLGLLASATLASISPAWAQTAGDQTDVVVIYGQRTDATVREVEESLTVVDGAAIDENAALSLYDVARLVPNLVEVNGGRGFAIRGIQQSGPSFAGQGQTLAVYVDDLPLSDRQTFAGPLDVWDLAQVEVYRGPQATTFGRNALAGAIYVRTADPTFDLDARARLEASEYGGRQYAAAVGGALVDDILAGRISYSQQETDGFNTNVFLNEPADARKAETLRGKLLFTPAPDIDVLASVTYFDALRGDDLITPISTLPRREIAYDTPARQGSEGVLGSLRATWRLSGSVELTAITTGQDSDYIRFEDFDGSPAPIASLDRTGKDRSFSQEFRLRYESGRARGVVGAFYFDSEETFADSFLVPIQIVDASLPLDNFVSREGDFLAGTENWALFADGEYDLTDQLTLVAGVRYDRETYATDATQVTEILGALPPEFEFLRALVEGVVDDSLSTDFDAWLPKAGLRFAIDDQTDIGFTYSRGYRGGGVENNIVTGEPNEFGAEYLSNYEAYARGSMPGGLSWSANAYFAQWTDQQVSVPALAGFPGLTITENAGESDLWGAELEGSWAASDDLSFRGSLGYADTEFVDFDNPDAASGGPANYNGNAFPYASRWTGALQASWGADLGPFANATATFRSPSYNDIENVPGNRTDASTVVDLQAGWAFEHLRVTVFARNLFDESYSSAFSATPGADYARLGAPRVLGVRLDADY